MSNPKFLDIIRSFSEKEREEFSLFLRSPYFVRFDSEEMLRLFNYLVAFLDNNSSDILDKPMVHAAAYPEKPFSEARMERAMTRINQLAEQFLRTQYYQGAANSAQQMLDLAAELRVRNLAALYNRQLQKLKKSAQENALESTKNHFIQYQIAKEEHEWLSIMNDGNSDLGTAEIIEKLGLFYYGELLEMTNRFLHHQKTGAIRMSEMIQITLDAPPVPPYFEAKSLLLSIRKKIQDFFLRGEPNRSNFENLFEAIKASEPFLVPDTLSELYTFLRSYCTYLITTGNVELYETLHEIQKNNLQKGYFSHHGKIGPAAFITITRVALLVGKIQWAKDFVASQRHKILNEGSSEEVYKLNLAICLFEEKNYEEALLQIPYSFLYNPAIFIARRLELRAYFELGSDLLLYKIDAFRKFIGRSNTKKISDFDWEGNNNFVNLLLQLAQSTPKDEKRSRQLVQRIKEKKNIAERKWLLEKAMALA